MDLETLAETLKGFVQNGSAGGLFVAALAVLFAGAIIISFISAILAGLLDSDRFLVAAATGATVILLAVVAKWLRELWARRERK
jgi:uncharacterized membrane protein YqjE